MYEPEEHLPQPPSTDVTTEDTATEATHHEDKDVFDEVVGYYNGTGWSFEVHIKKNTIICFDDIFELIRTHDFNTGSS